MRLHLLLFISIIALWSLSLYFYNTPVLMDALGWLKMSASLTIIVVFTLFCLIIVISKSSFKKFKIPLAIAGILSLAIILGLFINSPLGIKNYLMSLSPEAIILLLFLFIYTSLGAAILFERTLRTSAPDHLEAIYILIAFAVFIITINVIYLFLPLITGSKEYLWLGPLSTVIFLLFSTLGHYLIKKSGEGSKREEEAENLAEEWKKLAQAKDQFLLSLQHHLRTPLTPLKIYLERILDGTYGREENPVIKEKLIEMKRLTETLYSLIESLLDIQELRLGKKILHLEDCQIESLIKSVIEELKPQAEQKGLSLIFKSVESSDRTDAGRVLTVKVDKKRTREALWNLVDNAVKYTRRGGITIKLEIENLKLKIIVSDTGIGMVKEEIDDFLQGRLFGRGKEAKKLYGPGRGIGLAIAVEFIKAQGGRILARSKGQGEGMTFWIELPIEK
jgi:signal transduction histidine kinase